MNAPVDVLAVLRRTSEGLHGIADGCRNPDLATAMLERAREFDAACAAVAELIEAADALADEQVYSDLDEPDYEPETSEPATNRNRHQRAYWRLRAALARCGGAP